MSIWNKILLGVIFVVAMVFFYMASLTVKIHTGWIEEAERLEREIDDYQKQNRRLIEGGGEDAPEKIGLRQARFELYRLTLDRSRVWSNCDPRIDVDPQTRAVAIRVTTDRPDPHGITKGTVLYVFEEDDAQKNGRYLGEFKVTEVAEKQINLEPAAGLTSRDMQKLASRPKTWILYEYLPKDDREVFAKLSDEEKKALLPDATENEYLRDGRPAMAEDPPERKDAEGNYVRPLRDYTLLLSIYRQRQTVLIDEIESLKRDVKYVRTAADDAERQNQVFQKQITALDAKLTKEEKQRDVVAGYRKQLETKLASLQTECRRLYQQNKAMAGRLAQLQWDAIRRIDQRTRAMVQQPVKGLQ